MRLVTPGTFKSLMRAKSAEPVGVRKQSVEKVESLDDRTLRFTISTGTVDRDDDIIEVAGWQLDNFQKNPVVLWSHNASLLPIGKAIDVTKSDDRLRAVVRFLPEGEYGNASAFAEEVYKLARDGWLTATSVGFRPLAWDFTEDEKRGGESWFPGIDFHSQELVELSIVSVPANPEALIEHDIVEPPVPVADGTHVLNYAIEQEARLRRRRAARATILGAR